MNIYETSRELFCLDTRIWKPQAKHFIRGRKVRSQEYSLASGKGETETVYSNWLHPAP